MISQGLVLVAGMGIIIILLILILQRMNELVELNKQPQTRLIPAQDEKTVVAGNPAVADENEEIAVAIAAINSLVK